MARSIFHLDGWWGRLGWEKAGHQPAPSHFDEPRRNFEDSLTLYELLQDKIIPLLQAMHGLLGRLGKNAKNSIASLLPRFNSARMVGSTLKNSICQQAIRAASCARTSMWRQESCGLEVEGRALDGRVVAAPR